MLKPNFFNKGTPAAPKAAGQKSKQLVHVEATKTGWYDNRRIEEGDKLHVPEDCISKVWMEVIEKLPEPELPLDLEDTEIV
jgi:hypothetical protein